LLLVALAVVAVNTAPAVVVAVVAVCVPQQVSPL
jgi:hypothetical protein